MWVRSDVSLKIWIPDIFKNITIATMTDKTNIAADTKFFVVILFGPQ